ncbi:unnamed protein product [Caenorhabditis bovis]|uniref:G-protein coupled receptors family 1 profile domain-containing protein n=1 Tax=Caenorhabditis bovis TaxID=2654633 RepID=A0A8S1E7X1_9PELO|nr:unnamed protein product [Caenorhabditis bovis]
MVYDVYGIACLQTFCPFLSLTMLNLVIVHKLAKLDSNAMNNAKISDPDATVVLTRKSGVLSSLRINKMTGSVRNAIYTMVAIVSTYLISNSLHIMLTLLEVTKSPILVDESDTYKASMLYTLLGDAVSILYMISSAIRIFIYSYCNPAIRYQLLDLLGWKKCTKNNASFCTSNESTSV